MLQKLNSRRGGFTLVEIMIVVAIIALLASIAVPNFLRARLRSQATTVLTEARMVDAARDQYLMENPTAAATVTWANLQPYLKSGSRLDNAAGVDIMGNLYVFTPKTTAVSISAATKGAFTDIMPATDPFWNPY